LLPGFCSPDAPSTTTATRAARRRGTAFTRAGTAAPTTAQPELRPVHLLRPRAELLVQPADNDNNRNEARRQPRFDRPENDVVCDRRTQVCYKDKEIDASETREKFGKDAARKVDRVRDRYDNNDIFLPRKNVVANGRPTCYQNGDPSRKQTREYFGDRAAKRVERTSNR
jgi:hypothetical protein